MLALDEQQRSRLTRATLLLSPSALAAARSESEPARDELRHPGLRRGRRSVPPRAVVSSRASAYPAHSAGGAPGFHALVTPPPSWVDRGRRCRQRHQHQFEVAHLLAHALRLGKGKIDLGAFGGFGVRNHRDHMPLENRSVHEHAIFAWPIDADARKDGCTQLQYLAIQIRHQLRLNRRDEGLGATVCKKRRATERKRDCPTLNPRYHPCLQSRAIIFKRTASVLKGRRTLAASADLVAAPSASIGIS